MSGLNKWQTGGGLAMAGSDTADSRQPCRGTDGTDSTAGDGGGRAPRLAALIYTRHQMLAVMTLSLY